jgi:hypothetical protein
LCPLVGETFALVSRAISAKDPDTHGNSARTVVRVLPLTALWITAIGTARGAPVQPVGASAARAEACPPAVALTGDEDAVRAVRDQLDARGIAGETPSCPVLRARIERRGELLVVAIERPTGPAAASGAVTGAATGAAIERAVGGPATAATVIESWARTDVAAPLLEARAVPPGEAESAWPTAAPAAPSPAARGIQLFAAAETSFASDHTVWEGIQLGACVMLGPICGAARVHGGKVIASPDGWGRFVRKGAEVYGGIDVPIALGRNRLTPGFAAGYGTMLTHHIGDGEKTGIEISGPRAEVHVAFTIPVTSHVAIDLATTAELTQATGRETHGSVATGDAVVFPDEPRALFRIAVGVRYGEL